MNRLYGIPSLIIKQDGLYTPSKFTPSTSDAASPVRVKTLTAAVANDEAGPGVIKGIQISNATQYDTLIRIRVWDKAVVDAAPTPAGDPVFEMSFETSASGVLAPAPAPLDVHLVYGCIIKVEGMGVGQIVTMEFAHKAKREFGPVDNFVGSTRLIQ